MSGVDQAWKVIATRPADHDILGIIAFIGEIKRRIDGKGIVIFTLDSGGTIRDTGKELFFSPQDVTAEIALRYGRKKWGKDIRIEGNRFCREETRWQRRGMKR